MMGERRRKEEEGTLYMKEGFPYVEEKVLYMVTRTLKSYYSLYVYVYIYSKEIKKIGNEA